MKIKREEDLFMVYEKTYQEMQKLLKTNINTKSKEHKKLLDVIEVFKEVHNDKL